MPIALHTGDFYTDLTFIYMYVDFTWYDLRLDIRHRKHENICSRKDETVCVRLQNLSDLLSRTQTCTRCERVKHLLGWTAVTGGTRGGAALGKQPLMAKPLSGLCV